MGKKNSKPEIGVGVIVLQNNQVLLGKRKNAHGDGDWSFPGGHLELFESWEECARRETFEETGILIKNVQFATATNDLFLDDKKHFVTLMMVCEYASGSVKVMEPDKCEKWEWFDWFHLPGPLFLPIRNLKRSGFNPLTFVNR